MSESTSMAVPNEKGSCCNCGASPTVDIINRTTGNLEMSLDTCGACTWGEADCLDPENW
ncbi:hypothetical protein [Vibrio coralliirubri]|uniref:hypothetical protein n=1 Tax=Vibrio coralliirubri TaxID=1516159 RepID=UPI000AEE10B0|nr:hypothetical protein [Vibrio coralliirubri]